MQTMLPVAPSVDDLQHSNFIFILMSLATKQLQNMLINLTRKIKSRKTYAESGIEPRFAACKAVKSHSLRMRHSVHEEHRRIKAYDATQNYCKDVEYVSS